MGLLGMHCICFGAFRLLENPPFSVEIGQPSFPFISLCVFATLRSFLSLAKFIWLHTRGGQILLIGGAD